MHRFAGVLALLTVVLITAGGIVTSRDAGNSVPTWPLAYGKVNPPGWTKLPQILAEHGHRLIAAAVGAVTVAFACCAWAFRRARSSRKVALAAVGLVLAQGLLGGLTVKLQLPPWVSIAHACLAQTFFCVVVLAFERTGARQGPIRSAGASPLRALSLAAVAAAFVQLLLGAIVRHSETDRGRQEIGVLHLPIFIAHLAGAATVIALIVSMAVLVRRRHQDAPGLVRPATLLLALIVLQIAFGIGSYAVAFGRGELVYPTFAEVAFPTAHVATGALILGTALVLALRAGRLRLGESRRKAGSPLRDYLEIAKPRLTALVLLSVLAGFYLGSDGAANVLLALNAVIGTALVAFGSGALNQVLERVPDGLMTRTQGRPLPAGRLDPRRVLVFGLVASFVGTAWLALFVNGLAAALNAVTLLLYVLVYTPLKTRTSLNTMVGAVAGAVPPMIGWAAARGSLGAEAWALFLIVFLWQFPHFLAIALLYREDYERGGFRMLPVVDPEGWTTGRQIALYAMALLPASLVPCLLGIAGRTYLLGALVLGAAFVSVSVLVAIVRTKPWARRLLVASIAYLPLLFLLMMLDKAVLP